MYKNSAYMYGRWQLYFAILSLSSIQLSIKKSTRNESNGSLTYCYPPILLCLWYVVFMVCHHEKKLYIWYFCYLFAVCVVCCFSAFFSSIFVNSSCVGISASAGLFVSALSAATNAL